MADIGKGWHIADIASGVTSAVVGGLDSAFGWSAKRQENAQKRLMDKQQDQWKEQQQILADQQLAQWNRENEYNDPTNYYKRLLQGADANGISKAGALGDMPGGNVGVSQSKNVPGSTSIPGVGGVQQQSIAAGMNTVLAGMRQRAEIANIESQTEKNYADAGLSSERSKSEVINRQYLEAMSNLADDQRLDGKHRRAAMDAKAALDRFTVDNGEALQPFVIDELISRSADAFERSLYTRKRRSTHDREVDSMIAEANSNIQLQGAIKEAYQELTRERELNNEHFEKICSDLAKEVQYNAEMAKYGAWQAEFDYNHAEGSLWWSRVGTAIGVGSQVVQAYGSVRGRGSTPRSSFKQDAIRQKDAYKRYIISRYNENITPDGSFDVN